MLSVKIGHYHPSLEDSFVETLQSLKKDDPLAPLAVVAPTNLMLNRLQERLVRGKRISLHSKCIPDQAQGDTGVGFMNIHFMNFFVIANEICRRSGTDEGQIIQQPVVYECIIEGLLKHHTLHEPLFENVQSLPTLARALFQVIQDLIDANVDIDNLKDAVREGFVDGAEMRKLFGVVHLYDMFRQKLKTLNISHYSDIYRLATACVSDSGFFKGFKHILAYGFYDLTGVEQDFFGEIFRSYPTTLFLPYQKKHPAFSYVKPFFESFVLGMARDIEELSTGDGLGFSYLMDSKSENNFVAGCELQVAGHRLNSQLTPHNLQYATRNTKPLSNIHVINASGKRDEVWTVAKEILKLADEGYKMEEIGVVARALEPYTDTIKKIFQENYIPFTTNAQEPLERYPLVKVIRQILTLKRENFYRPFVIEILGSPYFKIPSPANAEVTPRPDLWDIISRRIGIRNGIKCWLSRLKQWKAISAEILYLDNETGMSKDDTLIDENITPHSPPCEGGARGDKNMFSDEEETERRVYIPVNQIEFLENTLRMLSNDLSAIPEKASWTLMSHKIIQFLQCYIHIPSEGMNPEDEERDRWIINKIWGLLRTLCSLDCMNEEVSQDQFVDTFIEACRRESFPVSMENGRGVKVMDAMSARGIPFRALFIIGLNEKVFPRAIFEEPFLRDHVRQRLSEVLGNCIPEKLRGFDEERLLFYFLLNAARERLYLLYERSDETGKPKIPSHYLMDILQNIKAASATGEDFQEKQKYEDYIPRGIKDKLCKLVPAHVKQGKEISLLTPKEIGILMALYRIDPEYFMKAFGINPDFFTRSRLALDFMESYNPRLSAYDGVIADISQWWDEQARHGFGPTALEVFGSCPFKFFMGKVMELESLEEPEKVDVITAVDLGSLYHNILRDFYKTLIDKRYFDTKTKEINPIELLHGIAQKYFSEIERQIPIPYPTLWEIKKEEILTFLIRFITWDLERIEQTGYVPTYLERSVKLCSQDNLLKLIPICIAQGGSSKITLRGKIDRIDLKAGQDVTNFRVVDYKSGKFSKENLIKSAIRGQKLQLPFYIIMAEHLLSEEIKKGRIPQGQANLEDASFVYIAQDRTDKKGQKDIPAHTIKGTDWNDFQEQYWETVKEFLQYIREGMFPISPTEDTQKCEWCEFVTICRRSHQPLRFRLEQDARLKKYRDILKSDINKKSNKP